MLERIVFYKSEEKEKGEGQGEGDGEGDGEGEDPGEGEGQDEKEAPGDAQANAKKSFDIFDEMESRMFKLERMQDDIENKVRMDCTQMISAEFKELRFQMEQDRENK